MKYENYQRFQVLKDKMGEIIATTDLKREAGWLYYVATDKKTGNLIVCKAKLARGGRTAKGKK
jgi:hypothetical protein